MTGSVLEISVLFNNSCFNVSQKTTRMASMQFPEV
jgi:hypothetical protein